jgi:hypothetical protein
LPETPSYEKDYRDKFLIKTVKKQDDSGDINSSYDFIRESEIVIGTYSYDQNDYKEMHISYAWYRAFWTTGFAEETIKKIGMPLGNFTKIFYRSFFTNAGAGEFIVDLNKNISLTFEKFFTDQHTALLFDTEYTSRANLVKLIWMVIFTNLENFENEFIDWVNKNWPQLSKKEIKKDLDKTITAKNFLTKHGFIVKRSFTNDIFQGTKHKDQVEQVLQNYSSSSYPLPIKQLLKSKLSLF